ncbi:hypothetical protein ACFOOL_14660 [Devosia honganensis]|uniref:PilZ domain-containing protein n=2 Tax=Devosia honganensis TaxID=1610527 RepID=A0ABV7X5U2_9HYPH
MEALTERREEEREPPVLTGPAEAISNGGRIAVSVMNVSPSGIMLEMPEAAIIPALFTLAIGEHRHPCELIWRNGTRAGARLIGSKR